MQPNGILPLVRVSALPRCSLTLVPPAKVLRPQEHMDSMHVSCTLNRDCLSCRRFPLLTNKKIIHLSLISILIMLNGYLSGVLAATCDAVSGTTKTITASCSDLVIDGNLFLPDGFSLDISVTEVQFFSAKNTTIH